MFKVLSIGGSIIVSKDGLNITFLKKFKKLILDEVARGTTFILVAGGGSTARTYQDALRKMNIRNDRVLDQMGIDSTRLNASFLKYIFADMVHKDIIINFKKKISTKKSIIIAGGEKPGQSSDMAAIVLAKTYGATEFINCSNIDFVYDKDPHTYSDAQKIEHIDWQSFRRDIVGNVWEPGKHVPFDPIASRSAQKMNLTVKMLDGNNIIALKHALRGEKFQGTVIASY